MEINVDDNPLVYEDYTKDRFKLGSRDSVRLFVYVSLIYDFWDCREAFTLVL